MTSRLYARAEANVSPRAPVDGVLCAIGDTPLVALQRYLGNPKIRVWAKLEAGNPGGSSKDRPASRMLSDALEQGLIAPGTTVIESTSGNMGVGLAQACRYHGVRLICVVDTYDDEWVASTLGCSPEQLVALIESGSCQQSPAAA